MKVLNLYAGIGGNRKLWQGADVTAVEMNPDIAKIYQKHFPQDEVIRGDAHGYLEQYYRDFDFIWSSPPCQSHSSMRQNLAVRFRGTPAVYPDMKLYQEIIFLQHNFAGKWVIENVNPYYEPLIPARLIQRHLFWSNFWIPDVDVKKDHLRTAQIDDLESHLDFDLSEFPLPNKRQILRNCVQPELGLHVFEAMKASLGLKTVKELVMQETLF